MGTVILKSTGTGWVTALAKKVRYPFGITAKCWHITRITNRNGVLWEKTAQIINNVYFWDT
jgi:hypothetical protein